MTPHDCPPEWLPALCLVGGFLILPAWIAWSLLMPWWVPGSWTARPERRAKARQ